MNSPSLFPGVRRSPGIGCLLGLSLACTGLVTGAESPQFITDKPAAAIYHEGWIDLNKTASRIRTRILRSKSRRASPTCWPDDARGENAQMATLYGFPRVLKDELPTPAWKTALWKDGIGNIDEHMNGNTGWTNNLAAPKYSLPYSLHARRSMNASASSSKRRALASRSILPTKAFAVMHANSTSFRPSWPSGAPGTRRWL